MNMEERHREMERSINISYYLQGSSEAHLGLQEADSSTNSGML